MSTVKKLILLCLVASLLMITGCSDVQNRSKDDIDPAPSVSTKITVGKTTTTQGTKTTDGMDADLQKLITKTLSSITGEGTKNTKLFTEDSLVAAKDVFVSRAGAKTNETQATLNHMKSDKESESLVVAEISQKIVKDGKTTNLTGKIYFDTSGVVIGFDINDGSEEAVS